MTMLGLTPVKIKNIDLTTSFQPVTVDENLFFTHILMNTKIGENFEIKLKESDTETFVFSYDYGASPITYRYDRKYSSDETTLFFVKGSGTFQILFFIE